jgi:hypothetical protein
MGIPFCGRMDCVQRLAALITHLVVCRLTRRCETSGEQRRSGEGAGCNLPVVGAPPNDVSSQSLFLAQSGQVRRGNSGKSDHFFCIFPLTIGSTCDSLLSWSCCGHIVAGRLRTARKSAIVPALGKIGVRRKQKIVGTNSVMSLKTKKDMSETKLKRTQNELKLVVQCAH